MKFSVRETTAKKSHIKLSVKDKKLIQLLLQNARIPITQLAKKVGISKSAIVQKISSLKNKGVLLSPILHYKLSSYGEDLYGLIISTQIGIDQKQISEKILSLKEIGVVIWSNSHFNIGLILNGDSPQETVDKVNKIIEIKDFRLFKFKENWFHPPHMFKEVNDIRISKNEIIKIDEIDKKIINVLIQNPLATFAEISTKTRLAPLTIKKHLNFMEKNQIILPSYMVDFWLCGKEAISINLISRGKGNTDALINHLLKIPSVSNIWESHHEWNLNFILWVDEQFEANKIINDLMTKFAILNIDVSTIVGFSGK